ncbi:hypothetical protein AB0B89_36380, partial [Sphaerisporangium sp. NPDC049002]|uniref:hypothetical protein n=1 Tax=Sphaerisporangium sp. NPDC049002 TaxID=3155392 RepID=UPI0033CA8958
MSKRKPPSIDVVRNRIAQCRQHRWSMQVIAEAAGTTTRILDDIYDNEIAPPAELGEAILLITPELLRRTAARIPVHIAASRLGSLHADGWPLQDLADALRCDVRTVEEIVVHRSPEHVSRALMDDIDKVFDRLVAAEGPCGDARAAAAALGWATPGAYNNYGGLINDTRDEDLEW